MSDYGRSPAVEALPLMRQQATQDREDLESMERGGLEAEAARARFFSRIHYRMSLRDADR